MLLGLDGSFDALIFIGYQAKAGTEDGILAHTSTGNVIDLSVNGVSFPEAAYNAVMAGNLGVPVVLIAGDNWICEQATGPRRRTARRIRPLTDFGTPTWSKGRPP